MRSNASTDATYSTSTDETLIDFENIAEARMAECRLMTATRLSVGLVGERMLVLARSWHDHTCKTKVKV